MTASLSPPPPPPPPEQWSVRTIPRSREVNQGVAGVVWNTLRALAAAVPLVFGYMPDLVLVNGRWLGFGPPPRGAYQG